MIVVTNTTHDIRDICLVNAGANRETIFLSPEEHAVLTVALQQYGHVLEDGKIYTGEQWAERIKECYSMDTPENAEVVRVILELNERKFILRDPERIIANLVDFITSGRRYFQINPYFLDEVKEALKYLRDNTMPAETWEDQLNEIENSYNWKRKEFSAENFRR